MFRDAAAAVRELLHPRRDPAVHQLQVSPDQSEHGILSRDPVLTSDWLQLPRPRQPLHPRPRRSLLLALHKLLHPVVHQEGRSPQEGKGTVAMYLVKLSINKSFSNLDVNCQLPFLLLLLPLQLLGAGHEGLLTIDYLANAK